jgi:Helicase conserved C-terminal domain.
MNEPSDGFLFPLTATNFFEERLERRKTIKQRCELAADLVNTGKQAIIWCHLNPEGELLHSLIPGSVEISGRSTDEEKEEAFISFAQGQIQTLILKPKIGAWGMNWQNCSHIITFASHSYEQYYQAIRRCWRFGQKNPVVVDLVLSEGEERVKDNMRRKAEQADKMFKALITMMNNSLSIKIKQDYNQKEEIPSWL